MTPLESRRMSVKDHVNEKTNTNQQPSFRRITSRSTMRNSAHRTIVEGDHVDDCIRRESSFHERKAEAIANLFPVSLVG